ncbi:MAG: hypothetical protein R3248_14165 [Candidatus Promineifilaceae bacterium]|nr:hypothetical protein [Candidatus Promineifilaceae bacterium]
MFFYYILILRLLHIIAGVFWAGATFAIVGFVQPAVKATAPAGGRVMQQMVKQGRFSTTLAVAALVTAGSGILLYERVSGGFRPEWIFSGPGVALTIGGLAGIIAAVIGGRIIGPTSMRIADLGEKMQVGGGPPEPATLAEMEALQQRMTTWGRAAAVLLIVAIIGMSLADYM